MPSCVDTEPPGFDTDQANILVGHEGGENAHRIRSASNAGDNSVWKVPMTLKILRPGLVADHPLELTNHVRIGMRTGDRPNDVMSCPHIGNPIPHGLV